MDLVSILLVDDDPKNLTALESILASDDRRLVHALSGQEALRHLLHSDFAVILLDVHMPEMDGFETAELIRARDRSRDTPIIFLTAAVRGETFVAKGYSLGAVDYILKPFDPDIMRSKVGVFVELFKKAEQIKQQADQLAETTAFLNGVLEGATEYAITALDLNGQFLCWNEGARRVYGYTAEEMVGKQNVRVLHRPKDVEGGRVDALFEAVTRQGKVETEFQRVRKDGRTFSSSVVIDQLRDAAGDLAGYVSISRDITALKQAERERAQLIQEQAARAAAEADRDRLKELERQKDAFLAAASHDLKNPVAGIKVRAQSLERRAARLGTPEGAALAEGFRSIDHIVRRLTGMINELLDVTRLQMGRPLDLDRRPTDLAELAREVAADLQPSTERHQILVEGNAADIVGGWDRKRLERVFTNLVSNAIKYSPHGGRVTLRLGREGDNGTWSAVCQVSDEGIGIPAAELPRVFERFYRGSNVTGRIDGAGVGLAGVRQIVEEHGGSVSVESREQVGSTFTVRLPLGVGQ